MNLFHNFISMKLCSYCNEQIQDVAKKCRHCGEWLNAEDAPVLTSNRSSKEPINQITADAPSILWYVPYIVLGIIGVLVSGFLINYLNEIANLNIQSFTLLFIFPIGWAIVGALGSSFLFGGKFLLNKRVEKRDYVFSAFLGIAAFFLVYYVDYQNTYITTDEKVITSFTLPTDSTPVSQYLTFGGYIDTLNEHSQHNIRYKGADTKIDYDLGQWATTTYFYLYLLWALLWSVWLGLITWGVAYCEKCKKYKKDKIFWPYDFDDSFTAKEILESSEVISKESLKKLRKHDSKNKLYFTVKVTYCPNCREGSGYLGQYKSSGGNWDDSLVWGETMPLSVDSVNALISK